MEKLDKFRELIQTLLTAHGSIKPAYGDVELEIVFDTERDHYELLAVGWNGQRRTHGCIIHIDIKNEQIWIQHDGTEAGVANELVDLGVAKEDIVLAFHAPFKRRFTGFCVGDDQSEDHAA